MTVVQPDFCFVSNIIAVNCRNNKIPWLYFIGAIKLVVFPSCCLLLLLSLGLLIVKSGGGEERRLNEFLVCDNQQRIDGRENVENKTMIPVGSSAKTITDYTQRENISWFVYLEGNCRMSQS